MARVGQSPLTHRTDRRPASHSLHWTLTRVLRPLRPDSGPEAAARGPSAAPAPHPPTPEAAHWSHPGGRVGHPPQVSPGTPCPRLLGPPLPEMERTSPSSRALGLKGSSEENFAAPQLTVGWGRTGRGPGRWGPGRWGMGGGGGMGLEGAGAGCRHAVRGWSEALLLYA